MGGVPPGSPGPGATPAGGGTADLVRRAAESLAAVLEAGARAIGTALARLTGILNAKLTGGGAAPKPPKKKAPGLAARAGGVGRAALGAAAAPAGALIDVFRGITSAAAALPNLLGQMAGAVAPFVQAFDPGIMVQLSRAFQDLQASVGAILEPFVGAFVQVADLLNEAFTELAPLLVPVIREIADVLVTVFKAAIDAVMPVLRALVPILKTVADALKPLFEALGPLFKEVGALIADLLVGLRPIIEAVVPLLVSGLRLLVNAVGEAVRWIRESLREGGGIRDFVAGAGGFGGFAQFARIVNQPRFAEGAAPGAPGRTSAARPASYIGVEELGRAARLAAFGVRSAEDQRREEAQQARDQRREQIELLRRIAAQGGLPGAAARAGLPAAEAGAAVEAGVDAVLDAIRNGGR